MIMLMRHVVGCHVTLKKRWYNTWWMTWQEFLEMFNLSPTMLPCRQRMTRAFPGDTPWHSTWRSEAHRDCSAYLYRQSPLIHTSRSNSFCSHSSV